MHLTVKGKQLDMGDALRSHVDETLKSLVAKYFPNPQEGTVIVSKDAHLFTADITVRVGRGIVLQSRAEATEPYPAFDVAAERLAKRLRRYKRRLRDHHQGREGEEAVTSTPAAQYILEAESEDDHIEVEGGGIGEHGIDGHGPDGAADRVHGDRQPMVVAEMQTAIDTLTVSEAVMRMDLAELPALMFRNRAHGGLNMVYRRPDGHVGWIDPKGIEGAGA
jgi:ribosomal subunit interface protein